MQGNMSPAFTEGFVLKCLESGLSKAATAALLSRQSVVIAAETSPAFAAGYEKTAGQLLQDLVPRASQGFFLKQAIHVPAGTLRGGLKGLFRGLKDVGHNLGEIGKGTIGRLTPAPGSTKGLIRRNPLTSAAVAGIGGTGAGMGISHLLGGNNDIGEAPYLPAGGYNPEEAEKMREINRDAIARGVYDVNSKANQSSARRAVLQRAVDSHDVNSGKALQELNQMDQDAYVGRLEQNEYSNRLNKNQTAMEARLTGLEQRKHDVAGQRTAWWRAPLRWTGIEDSGTYDRRELAAEDAASRAAENLRLNEHARNLLSSGAVGQIPRVSTPSQATNFFPTYDQ